MAERKNFSRYNMRCGLVLRADKADVHLDGFEMADLDARFLAITAKDIPGENTIDVMGTKIPLLADDYISYVGQPLLVLFGPDYESTELAVEKIKPITTALEEKEKTQRTELPPRLLFSWGLENEEEVNKAKQSMRKVESSLWVLPCTLKSHIRYDVLSWVETNGTVHIQTPTQWPELVKKTAAGATLLQSEAVVIHNEEYLAEYDEMLLTPAIYGAFTAIATMKTKLPCEMREERQSRLTGLEYSFTSWLDEENRPRHEEVSVIVNQGAYAINGEEIQRQIMVAIVPKYNLDSFSVNIGSTSFPTMPSLFSGSSIYSFSSAAVALHNTHTARRALSNPLSYPLQINMDSTRFTSWTPKHELVSLNEKVENLAERSDFARKWSAASLHSGILGLQGYLYGIGISSGLAISALSTTCSKEHSFSAQISYTAKKNIAVTGSIPLSISQDKTLKDLILQYFDKNPAVSDTVLFIESGRRGPDTGPDILSSYDTAFLTQLMKAANKLSSLIGDDNGPVDLNFNAQNLSLPCDYEYSGYGVAVCEITIPKVSLDPIAQKLWLDMSLALPSTRGVVRRIKSIAIETLSSLGARISSKFSIDISFTPDKKNASLYSSIENTTKMLVTGAYTTALWQVLGEKSNLTLPTLAGDVDKIIGGKNK